MQFDTFHELIKKRAATNPEWDYGIEKCRDEMTVAFCADINETIRFLDEECTGEELIWLSEVFENIAARTQSEEFIAAIKRTAAKYPVETEMYYIADNINYAECLVGEEDLR